MPPLAIPNLVLWSSRASWREENPGAEALEITEDKRRSCVKASYSWCEACYGRIPETEEFGIVCQSCDSLHQVCALCKEGGVSWAAGHQAFLDTHHGEDEETFEVTAIDGEACTTTRISFQELSASTGRSIEQLKAEIRARIRDP